MAECKEKKNRDSNELAELRTTFARTRTYQAAEKTYTAWIRTGFTVAGAGVTLGTALRDTRSQSMALVYRGYAYTPWYGCFYLCLDRLSFHLPLYQKVLYRVRSKYPAL